MEELPNFQLFSSQNSDLDNEQLDEIEQKAQAKNTKRATEWGVKKFEKWCEKRKITVDLKTVSATDLSEILRKFFAEVKTEKGQALTPSALTGIRFSVWPRILIIMNIYHGKYEEPSPSTRKRRRIIESDDSD